VAALQGIEQLSEISLRHPVFLDAAGEGGTEDKHSLSTPVNLKQTFLLGNPCGIYRHFSYPVVYLDT
jgi:hypothetical protein